MTGLRTRRAAGHADQEILTAFEILSDPEKRRRLDGGLDPEEEA